MVEGVAFAELGDGGVDRGAACEVVFGFAAESWPGVGAGSRAFEAGSGGVDGVEMGAEGACACSRQADV